MSARSGRLLSVTLNSLVKVLTASTLLLYNFISKLLYCIENSVFLEEKSKFNQTREAIVPAEPAKVGWLAATGPSASLSSLLHRRHDLSDARTETRGFAKWKPRPRASQLAF